ncbi:phenylacetate--CoA ligase family protein [Brevibacillus sp. H7]|uniref:phenylacetate--CoA ligase family protein n=1 Tax=Brevibacillus sp. H7 TaxID=3349138 RepID=UPI0038167BE7
MPLTGYLIRHVHWPLMERLKENRTRAYLQELRDSQHMERDALLTSQRRKLGKLLQHAVQNVPAYTEFASDFADSADQPERFLQSLPVLTKGQFRAASQQYLTRGADTSRLISNRTGGSTGEPTHFYLDRPTVERYEAARWLGLSWHGIRIGDSSVMIWGSPIELGQQQANCYRIKERWLKNRLMIPAYNLDERRLEHDLGLIRRFRPAYLYGYASALYTLAEMMRQKGTRLRHRLKAVVSTAESLHDYQREAITDAFQAPVVNEYGARDGGIIAYQCPAGRMHAFSENSYLEVVDPVTGHPLPPGQTGQLLVTDLYNYVMPRLRYQLGDIVAFSPESCSCGIQYPLLAQIDGREDDMFVSTRGNYVHGHYFNHIVRNMEGFRTFQIVQHEPHRLTLKLVKDPNRYSHAEETRLLAGIRSVLGEDVFVSVRYVEEIPPAVSGKARYAIREFPLVLTRSQHGND